MDIRSNGLMLSANSALKDWNTNAWQEQSSNNPLFHQFALSHSH